MREDPGVPEGVPRPRGGIVAYATAVSVMVLAILSQYFVPQGIPALRPLYGNLAADLLIVYGVPALAFLALVGTQPLERFAANLRQATVEGLRWYGLLSLVALAVTVFLAIAYLLLDPSALSRLGAPNPDIRAASRDPWFWVGFSFVIGLVEETLFRGWVFGYWLARGTSNWERHAIWTSLLFVAVHPYYATTYGAAAGLVYPMLFFLGLSFALAMRASGGNVLVIGLLHGAFDSAAFLTLVSLPAGEAFRYGVVGIGFLVAVALYLRGASRPGTGPNGPGTA